MSEDIHSKFLTRCIRLAQRGGKDVKANPKVGAVLVYNQKIIGEGYHKKYGGPHAEVNAVNSVAPINQKHISQSTLYVSLEPCNHIGKTGPCTEFILRQNIPHVVIAQRDPNKSIKTGGIERLKEAGVKVELQHSECAEYLTRPFTQGSLDKIPYVILKYAQSKDFYMGKKGKQVWISNRYSQHLVHKWRSEIDAIMVGTKTVLTDNPKLTNRLHPGDSPIRVILDRNGLIDEKFHVSSGDPKTIVYTETEDLLKILKDLYIQGIHTLMVEGGKTLLSAFIDAKLWHEARIITSSNYLKTGLKAPTIKGKLVSSQSLADDLIQVVYAA